MNFLDESFWLAVSFIIFMYLAYRPTKKIILKALDVKVLEVQEKVLKAEKLKEDMQLLFEQINAQIKNLEVLGAQMLEEEQKHIEKITQEKNNEITEFLEHKKTETIKLIESKRIESDQALKLDYCNKVTELVSRYFQLSQNADLLSEIDIAKNLSSEEISK
jgi:F-type H+-transporting ATPase subunit b